jgi:hypothetical protein
LRNHRAGRFVALLRSHPVRFLRGKHLPARTTPQSLAKPRIVGQKPNVTPPRLLAPPNVAIAPRSTKPHRPPDVPAQASHNFFEMAPAALVCGETDSTNAIVDGLSCGLTAPFRRSRLPSSFRNFPPPTEYCETVPIGAATVRLSLESVPSYGS